MSAVRLAEVAARAGVSPMTVSRALRTPEKLAPETRERVAAAMRELGYVPNLLAGALASARSRSVAVLVPTIGYSIFASTVDGIAEELEPHGLAIILAQSGYDATREEHALAALLSRRPEALMIVGAPASENAATLLRRANIPVVELWELPEQPIDAAVGFDNAAAGAAVAAHFLASGRRHLAFMGSLDRRSELRWRGFANAVTAAGLTPPQPVRLDRPTSSDAATACAPQLRPDIDAVFASSDAIAFGLLTGLRQLGRRVPGDIAVVGLGDVEIARHAVPPLSTIRIDGREIGRHAARLLLAPDTPRRVDLGFALVLRESG